MNPTGIEAAARAMCHGDPDEIMPNDGPRWKYYVPGAQAAIQAYLAATLPADVAGLVERLTQENARLKRELRDAEIHMDVWKSTYAQLRVFAETDTPAEAKVKRQAKILTDQQYRIRTLRAEIRRHLKNDPLNARGYWPNLKRWIDQNRANFARFKAAEAALATARGILRETTCPRPANHRPDEFTAGECVKAGECGCHVAASLTGVSSNG